MAEPRVVTDFDVAAVDVSAYTVPTELPEADGTLAWDKTTVVVVDVETRAGVRGLGFAYGHTAMVDVIKQTLVPEILGRDVRDTTDAWSAMVRSIRNLGRPGIASMAISAVDLALWDAKARASAPAAASRARRRSDIARARSMAAAVSRPTRCTNCSRSWPVG